LKEPVQIPSQYITSLGLFLSTSYTTDTEDIWGTMFLWLCYVRFQKSYSSYQEVHWQNMF